VFFTRAARAFLRSVLKAGNSAQGHRNPTTSVNCWCILSI